jgi:hypothetical protein
MLGRDVSVMLGIAMLGSVMLGSAILGSAQEHKGSPNLKF